MKSDQRTRKTKKTLRAFTTVTALSTHANNARFHYGHCAFNTRKHCALSLRSLRFQHTHKTQQNEHAKNKWQPKRVMWITATRRRPMTRFLHACGSVRGAQACGRVGGRVSGCASVRVCVWGGGEGGGAQHLSSCFLRYCIVALLCELKSLGNAIGNGNGQGVAAGLGVGA